MIGIIIIQCTDDRQTTCKCGHEKLTRLKFIKISNSWQFATAGTAADKRVATCIC